jgi:cytochrome P450
VATVRPLDSPVQQETSGQLDLAFLDRNPPDHGRLRKLATPAFRPALMRGYRDQIAGLVDRLLGDVRPG